MLAHEDLSLVEMRFHDVDGKLSPGQGINTKFKQLTKLSNLCTFRLQRFTSDKEAPRLIGLTVYFWHVLTCKIAETDVKFYQPQQNVIPFPLAFYISRPTTSSLHTEHLRHLDLFVFHNVVEYVFKTWYKQ